jgi:hypothetical protein
MSSKNIKAKNHNHQPSTRHNSGKPAATNSAPLTEKVILRPTHLTDLSRHTNLTKWLRFLKRDTESDFKSLSEIFDPKNNFKFQTPRAPVKSTELRDHELAKAVFQRRRPQHKTNPDIYGKNHDAGLREKYLDEMVIYEQEVIMYESTLDTLSGIYKLELKAWDNEVRESLDKRKASRNGSDSSSEIQNLSSRVYLRFSTPEITSSSKSPKHQ